MGTAVYYMTCRYKTPKAAEKALPELKAFFSEVGKAYEYWQENWGSNDRKEFWKNFKLKFPAAHSFLKWRGLADGDHNNALAGEISFGDAEAVERMHTVGHKVRHCEETWHCADWGPLADYIKENFGAADVAWLSDEYIEPFDLL